MHDGLEKSSVPITSFRDQLPDPWNCFCDPAVTPPYHPRLRMYAGLERDWLTVCRTTCATVIDGCEAVVLVIEPFSLFHGIFDRRLVVWEWVGVPGVEMRLGKSRSRWDILGDMLGMWILKIATEAQNIQSIRV